MKIYFDENLPPQLAEGLNILEKPNKEGVEVLSVKTIFGKGSKDEEWIPKVGAQSGITITRDIKINTTRQLFDLYRQNGVGVFFFTPPKNGYKYWQMVEILIKQWKTIKDLSRKNKKPFAFRIKIVGGIEKMN